MRIGNKHPAVGGIFLFGMRLLLAPPLVVLGHDTGRPRAVRIFFGGMYKNVCDAVDSRRCGNDEGFEICFLVCGVYYKKIKNICHSGT